MEHIKQALKKLRQDKASSIPSTMQSRMKVSSLTTQPTSITNTRLHNDDSSTANVGSTPAASNPSQQGNHSGH